MVKVKYTRHKLTAETNLVDWSSGERDERGWRPQVTMGAGKRVLLRIETLSDRTVYTAFTRRNGRFWSSTRAILADGRVLDTYTPWDLHRTLEEERNSES